MFGEELVQAFRDFKAIWDPDNRMNPGKVIDPYRADEHLRLGPEYKPVEVRTKFSFETDVGKGFVRATEHCIGMGKCRSHAGGTMCPSYRATREERKQAISALDVDFVDYAERHFARMLDGARTMPVDDLLEGAAQPI